MSYLDLPADWPQRRVTDEQVFAGIVDLVVPDADRRAGAVHLLLCGPTGRLVQPCAVSDLPAPPVVDRHRAIRPFAQALSDTIPTGGLVLVVARPGRSETGDDDRAWHQAAIEVCHDAGVQLLAAAVATPARIWRLPDARPLVASA